MVFRGMGGLGGAARGELSLESRAAPASHPPSQPSHQSKSATPKDQRRGKCHPPLLLLRIARVVHQHQHRLTLLLPQLDRRRLLAAAGVPHHMQIRDQWEHNLPEAVAPGGGVEAGGLAADGEEEGADAAVAGLWGFGVGVCFGTGVMRGWRIIAFKPIERNPEPPRLPPSHPNYSLPKAEARTSGLASVLSCRR